MKKFCIFFLLIFVTGCGYDKYDLPDDIKIDNKDISLEVFSTYTLDDLIEVDGAKLLNGNKKINKDEIGNFKVNAKLEYDGKEYIYRVKYKVIDTVPPVLIRYSSTRTVLVGNDIYPCEDLIYADNYDNKPSCEIEGDFNTTVPDTYNLEYVIKDNSNNELRKDLTIKVVKKLKSSSSSSSTNSTTKKLLIKDVIKKYKTDDTMIGIDVSRWQGNIDYEKVKNAGVEFVIMRIGVQSSSDGIIEMDSYYKQNIKNAKDAGLKVGVYVYSTAVTDAIAKHHAKWVVDTLDGIELDFPIAYDWENWNWFMDYELSLHDLSHNFVVFEKEVKKYGYEAMLYSSKFYLENMWINYTDAPVWLAHYTSKTNYKGDYIMWQMSNTGKVDGIDGDVDINIYYKEK